MFKQILIKFRCRQTNSVIDRTYLSGQTTNFRKILRLPTVPQFNRTPPKNAIQAGRLFFSFSLKQIFVFPLLLISLSSCNSTYQYGVYVKNETGEDLKVAYKSSTDVKGVVEETVILRDGEGKMVIWTKDLTVSDAEDTGRTSATHSHLVADYVNGFIKENIPSKIKWNSEDIRFERTDIGQAEFMITYTAKDF